MDNHRKLNEGDPYGATNYNDLKRTVILKIGFLFWLSIGLAFTVGVMISSEYPVCRISAVILALIVALLVIRIGIIEYAHIMRRQKAEQSNHLTSDH